MKSISGSVLRFIFGLMTCFIFTAGVKAAAAENVGTVTEADGISAYIITDKAEYEAGEVIDFTIVVENNKIHSYTAKTTITYTNSPELIETEAGSIPVEMAKLEYGSKAELTGTLIGDASVFPPVQKTGDAGETDAGNNSGNADDAGGSDNGQNAGGTGNTGTGSAGGNGNDTHSKSNTSIIIAVIAAVGAAAAYFILRAHRRKEAEASGDKKESGSDTGVKVLALIVTGALLASLIGMPVKAQADDFCLSFR